VVELEAGLSREADLQQHPVVADRDDISYADVALVHPFRHEVFTKPAWFESRLCLGKFSAPLGIV
jgi:hypothetical protein